MALPVDAKVGVALDALVIRPSAPTTITGIIPVLPYVEAVTPDGDKEIVELAADVILPLASIVITGTIVALPYVAATTPELAFNSLTAATKLLVLDVVNPDNTPILPLVVARLVVSSVIRVF